MTFFSEVSIKDSYRGGKIQRWLCAVELRSSPLLLFIRRVKLACDLAEHLKSAAIAPGGWTGPEFVSAPRRHSDWTRPLLQSGLIPGKEARGLKHTG